ncbi:MAG: hypothetical protein Q8P71_00275 [bacterium]|nr:hypothetical protein [bacterium]
MKKKFYIIPGWRETCRRRQYQDLGKAVNKKGHEPIFVKVDWNNKISEQIFTIEKDSIIFGFSLGALLARLVVQKYECELVIFASMTPLRHFKGGEQEKMLMDVVGNSFIDDVKKNLKNKIKAKRKVLIYGDKEGETGDFIVKNTDHEISKNYIKKVLELM